MKVFNLNSVTAALMGVGLVIASSAFAEESALPTTAEKQAPAVQAAQSDVDKEAANATNVKREKLLKDAVSALAETKQALSLLEEKKADEAVEALAKVTGKLEIIVARDPLLALAPVDVSITTHDLLASAESVNTLVDAAKELLDDGEVQLARPLLKELASEMVISTTNLPLATYPDAIKAITPLIDAGKFEEAKKGLSMALSTLVVTNEVIPLPTLRAEILLANAEELAQKQERTDEENKALSKQLKAAKNQLKLAEALGYGNKQSYKPMYKEIEKIEEQSSKGKSATGWFDSIKRHISDLIK